MEGFRVEAKNMNTIYQSENQADWLTWRKSTSGKELVDKTLNKAAYKSQNHTPSFPKLGIDSKIASLNNSNLKIGNHNEVFAPNNIIITKNKAQSEHIRREREAEQSFLVEQRKKLKFTREDWVELKDKNTNKPYFFNRKNGKILYDSPMEFKCDIPVTKGKDDSFVLSSEFKGEKRGYYFSRGSFGLGYYREKTMEAVAVSNDYFDKKKELEVSLIATARRALEKLNESTTVKKRAKTTLSDTVEVRSDPSKVWKKVKNPLTRRIEYLNTETKQTSKTKPY